MLASALLTAGPAAWSSPAPSLVPAAVSLPTDSLPVATAQPVNVPARVARVAEVPGSNGAEAWAIGYSSAAVPGWSGVSSVGQVVFLHYCAAARSGCPGATGWLVTGPPRSPGGDVVNPRLLALAVASDGEGWAAGDKGVLIHHSPGGGWVLSDSHPTTATLESISLVGSGGGLVGYAVGSPDPTTTTPSLTILRLAGGQWSNEGGGVTTTNPPALIGVSAASAGEAWAVSGEAAQSAVVASVNTQALFVYHRDPGSGKWSPVKTGQNMFDGPPAAAQDGPPATTIQAAIGGAVSATPRGAWVVGRMVPNQSGTLTGDQLTGDRSRPFAIWFPASGSAVLMCTGVDQVNSSGQPNSDNYCQNSAGPGGTTLQMPLAAFGLGAAVSFQAPANASPSTPDELFAGGMGLLHFVPPGQAGRGWHWEPDGVGFITSLAMASPDEGWIASTGSNSAGASVLSQTLALAHWTKHPAIPAAQLWPDPSRSVVQGVALDPDGSGQALAVGSEGALLHYVPQEGWILQNQYGGGLQGRYDLHAISWPAPTSAWAVGNAEHIAHWNGGGWEWMDGPPIQLEAVPDNLFGVAFAGAGTGWAVGSSGTILDYSGGRWHRDPASNALTASTLYAITAIPGGAIAVGEGGTVLIEQGGSWHTDGGVASLLAGASATPVSFYAATSLANGWAALGGTGGVVVLRSPGGGYSLWRNGIEGTVVALGLTNGASGQPEVLASIDPDSPVKYVGGGLVSTQGWLFLDDGSGWQDIETGHQVTTWTSTDTAAPRDPVYSIALEPRAARGWAVGGFPALTVDDETRSYESNASTGGLYRVDVGGNASPPSQGIHVPAPPARGFTIAFLGDSACSNNGLCGPSTGSGTMADTFLADALQEINTAGPDLTLFGGNMRGLGLPEELDVVKRLMGGLRMPAYAAIGNQDLVDNLQTAGQSAGTGSSATTGAGYYLQTFGDEPAPWGNAAAPSSVRGIGPAAGNGEALTHYAFDFTPTGLPTEARIVVLNDSDGTLNDTNSNPSGSSQPTWLAGALNTNLPTIVVMNQPVGDPRTTLGVTCPTTNAAGSTMISASTQAQHAPAAVLSSFYDDNMSCQFTVPSLGTVRQIISGGAGSPLEGTRNPRQGYYHAWLLLTVDPSGSPKVQPPLAMPVLQSVAMTVQPAVGRPEDVLPAEVVHVHLVGRTPDAGLGNLNGTTAPDGLQSNADYLTVPDPADTCLAQEQPSCAPSWAIQPYHQFWSENNDIAEFVKPCPNAVLALTPCVVNGQFVPDPYDGFLCLGVHKTGTTWIDGVIGLHAARQKITVGPGTGACRTTPAPPPVPPKVPAIVPQPPAQPAVVQPQVPPVPAPVPRPIHHFLHPILQNQLIPAVIPPPVPVLAAGPPLPAAGTAAKKEEEREKAFEHSQESGGHTHQAVAYRPDDARWDPRPMAAAGAGALAMLIVASAWASTRRRSAAAIDVRRWE